MYKEALTQYKACISGIMPILKKHFGIHRRSRLVFRVTKHCRPISLPSARETIGCYRCQRWRYMRCGGRRCGGGNGSGSVRGACYGSGTPPGDDPGLWKGDGTRSDNGSERRIHRARGRDRAGTARQGLPRADDELFSWTQDCKHALSSSFTLRHLTL